MMNATFLYSNKTKVSYGSLENIRILYLSMILPPFCLYLPSVIVILCVFFTTSRIRENVRYLLFSHMIISDSLQLSLAFFLFIAVLYHVFLPVKWCCLIAGVSASTTLITPYNLALMSLERYIAVCFPLRHGVICTVRRCNVAILVMWGIGALPIVIELLILSFLVDNPFFSRKTFCIWRLLQVYNFQITIRFLTFSLSFTVVVIIIGYTYIKVIMVARKMGSGTSSASKAAKTVLLHGFQLLLCLCSFSSTFTENLFKKTYKNMAVINFFVFMCLPQYISPFIYGVRDEIIRARIRKLICST
ncbi:odorant receptor 131-2-like [Dendropsophus ebraccatus]|uniref:odorant receptor 131-2-like n=1 Tax=Dendropsophus ebraccatus TaxID=150705 RepID=UPI0038323177